MEQPETRVGLTFCVRAGADRSHVTAVQEIRLWQGRLDRPDQRHGIWLVRAVATSGSLVVCNSRE